MRTRKAILNIVTALLSQVVSIVCGFIVPSATIAAFGSEIYGTIGSITQYLGFIVLLESGVGGITRAALYKPLAEKDTGAINSIVAATELYFRKIGFAFIVYSIAVGVFFPYITSYTGEWITSFVLTIAIAAGTLAQYMFGITYSVLLQADQRSFISYIIQMASTVMNTIVVVALISLHCDVITVKAGSALVFVLRPMLLGQYVKRRYRIESAEPNLELVQNRWSGLGHHFAYYLRSNIAIVILSIFSPMSEIAVFSIYNLVANGLQTLVNAFSSGIEAGFGNIIAKDENQTLDSTFSSYETIGSSMVIVAFSTAIVMIIPFVNIYASKFGDADYIRPWFSVCLLIATAVYCFRLPYNTVTLAAGHYRQTMGGAFVEAGLCVFLTLALVPLLGLFGSAIALLIATVVRTFQYGVYSSEYILKRDKSCFYKRALFLVVAMVICCFANHLVTCWISFGDYLKWSIGTLLCVACSSTIVIVLLILFYKRDLNSLLERVRRLVSA